MGVREGGNERYFHSILRQLGRLALSEDQYYVFSYRGSAAARLHNLPLTHIPLQRRSVMWQRGIELPRYARRLALDVLHVPFNFLPVGRARKIVTIHDLAFLHLPEVHGLVERKRLQWLTRLSARHANHVLTVSELSRREISDYYGVPPERITVAPNAVDRDVFRPLNEAERAPLRKRLGVDYEYILHVGTMHPRKNLPVLIEAFARLRARGCPHHLVLIGRTGQGTAEVFRLVRKHGLEMAVHHLQTLCDHELAAAYASATVLVVPSLYEGFGVPVLEAMSCGCPVVSSSGGALPEVCGDAAVLFDPRDADALAAHLERTIADRTLRGELIARGLTNCERFSWERTTAIIAGVYHLA